MRLEASETWFKRLKRAWIASRYSTVLARTPCSTVEERP
jgi:hypothetical protein